MTEIGGCEKIMIGLKVSTPRLKSYTSADSDTSIVGSQQIQYAWLGSHWRAYQ